MSGVRADPSPPFEILVSAFAFEVDTTPAAIASIIQAETQRSASDPATHLSFQVNKPVDTELCTQLVADLLQKDVTLGAAQRAARVFRASLATMQIVDAQALAVEVAQLISDPTYAKRGLSANCKSFAALEARAKSSEFN